MGSVCSHFSLFHAAFGHLGDANVTDSGEYLHRSLTYIPHLTIGRVKNQKVLEFALDETEDWNEVFETTVHQIVVERIDEHESAIIEITVPLIP